MALWDDANEEYQDKPCQQSEKTSRKVYMSDLFNAVIASGEKSESRKI